MPIVGIASIAMGASALAAGATGFAALSAIGGIVGGIGILTKSKELTILGGIAGLAGGVASFAQSQGWISGAEAASNAKALASTPTPGLDTSSVRGTPSMDVGNAVEFGDAAAMPTGGLEGATQQAITQSNPLATPAAQALSGPSSGGLMNNPGGLLASTDPSSLNAVNGSDLMSDQFAASGAKGAGGFAAGQKGDSGVFGALKSFGAFLKENKELAQIGASFIGGAFDPKGQYYEDMGELEKQRARNANDIPNLGLKLKKNGPVFPTTRPTYTLPRIGLMNAG